jgi:hypothetical protein
MRKIHRGREGERKRETETGRGERERERQREAERERERREPALFCRPSLRFTLMEGIAD